MLRRILPVLVALGTLPASGIRAAPAESGGPEKVVVIPLHDEVATPMLYVLRRGLKEAIASGAEVVVLDLDTPGGALDVTLDMMEAIEKFPGLTLTYVDSEALSAGSFISATTDEIWFTPDGVIGAAAPVQSTGEDVDSTMRLKVTSYLKAKMRAISEGRRYRGQVISAMIDPDYELVIDGQVLKGKGSLLSLTATEASKTYGDPPEPLLSAGTAASLDSLLTQRFGAGRYTVEHIEVSWSEGFATFLQRISAILLGLGLLALYIEFKTPGFGVFGVTGILLLALVFLGNYLAGLSGHEPVLVFVIGVLLVMAELFLFPGVAVLAISGAILMLGALVWSMTDLWPNEPVTVAWSNEAFSGPLLNLGEGLALAVILAVALARFLPHGWIWDRLVVQSAVGGSAQAAGSAPGEAEDSEDLIGRRGVAATALRPGGQIEVGGRRYEARVMLGDVAAGEPVVVRGRSDFGLLVEKAES